jgi:group I intron endonuclease
MVVYKTTNLTNGKIYVGKDEFNNPSYLGSGYVLRLALEKYGKENFKKEVLEECSNRHELCNREKHWINQLNALDPNIGYNIAEGGTGGNTFIGKTPEEMVEIKKKISDAGKGRIFSESHRKALAKSASKRKGNKPSTFKGMKLEDHVGQERAKQIKDKIRESLKEYYKDGMPQEHREKISKSQKGRKLGAMSDEHKKNLKESFKSRDAKRRENTISKLVAALNDFLRHGVNDKNCNAARRSYQKLRDYEFDMKPYDKLVIQFKEIEFNRRSNRKGSQSSRTK